MHSPSWDWKLISLVKPTWVTPALPLLESTSASPRLGKSLGEGLAWGTARKAVMQTEPPLSALQNEGAQRALLSKQHSGLSELRLRHNTERYRPGKHPLNQTKAPCPWEKQQKVQRHWPDLAFPRVSPSSALHHERKGSDILLPLTWWHEPQAGLAPEYRNLKLLSHLDCMTES